MTTSLLRSSTLLFLLAAGVLTPARAEEKVPLRIDLPPPLFVGTPTPVSVPNLERPEPGKRPPLLVPAGTVLLSRGKPVTSSDQAPVIGELDYVTDGDKTSTEGTYVELGPGVQWVQIDLQAVATIEAVVVWHFHAEARVYHDVVVLASNDPAFQTGVRTLFNNDAENAAGRGAGTDRPYIETYEGRLIEAHGAVARYVRLYSNGNTANELNHYAEVEVYGFRRNRLCDWAMLGAVFLAALWLRTHELSRRPMHADEANQAVKLGALLERGSYAYDPGEHHGPALYYFALIPAWLRHESTLSELSEDTLRLTPAVFGTAAVLLVAALAAPLGRRPATLAAAFAALSPGAVYYSRYFIHETLLVAFTLAALGCAQRWWRGGRLGWALAAGASAGLMAATKETAPIFLAAAAVALLAARPFPPAARAWPRPALLSLGTAAAVAALFYSSFGRHPAGLRDALAASAPMLGRAVRPGPHDGPWWYYAGLLGVRRQGGLIFGEAPFLAWACVGAGQVLRWASKAEARLLRFVGVYTALLAAVFSLVRYKVPWVEIHLVPGLAVLAAAGVAGIARRGRRSRLCAMVLMIGTFVWQGWQTRRACFQRAADPRNPLAYAHTAPDMLKVGALAAAAMRGAPQGVIKVISEEYWPLPWYLRAQPRVGYWSAPPADCDARLVIASAGLAGAVRSRLHGAYREDFLGLRPGFVLIVFTRAEP